MDKMRITYITNGGFGCIYITKIKTSKWKRFLGLFKQKKIPAIQWLLSELSITVGYSDIMIFDDLESLFDFIAHVDRVELQEFVRRIEIINPKSKNF